ncbi:Mur ligase family protein [Aurantimicrobium minutum]|uniref:Mur ligase family protein n=1 Tax=Aurantimicrobium minutum TaxID=708131 RepID=UPI002475BFF9|nr:UDP-N-acetylmuramoyl-L-alanyl-D-glutamate--2,6-diaminopimelate ligase [Aurantimicrobium minutum]MDH6422437.1 UDP-N-acetylmuramoyl-L-alanyl-D-glutamate--2,6-diaminopimelate ligase [Aurantimicrobium minutum]
MGAFVGSLRPEHPLPRALTGMVTELGLSSPDSLDGLEVTGITLTTKDVHPGDIFVGMPGAKVHGAKFASVAAEAGAVAVLTDTDGAQIAQESSLPVIVVEDVRASLGHISSWIYRTDDLDASVFGVTGTNGKTSVVYLLSALLKQLGVRSGLSSTAERRIGDVAMVSGLTTPEATEMHALIARMKESSVRAICLEVSAQALSRHRVDGIEFDVVGFTNLSHDHFDDYAHFEDYYLAKAELFSPDIAAKGVVTVDDEWGVRLAEEARIPLSTLATIPGSIGWESAQWKMTVTAQTQRETAFTLHSPDGRELSTTVPLLGSFMAANAALAIVMLVQSGFDLEHIAHVVEESGGIDVVVPGRTEIVSGEHGPVFYLDYGHTPDAFTSLLAAVREVTPGKVVFLFGADGNRDTTKRFAMGNIAATGADVVVITDYHPRTEDPATIRAALLEGAHAATSGAVIIEEADVRTAIARAIAEAAEGDAIIYAGPGHETEREVASGTIPFDFRQEITSALRDAGYSPGEEQSA